MLNDAKIREEASVWSAGLCGFYFCVFSSQNIAIGSDYSCYLQDDESHEFHKKFNTKIKFVNLAAVSAD